MLNASKLTLLILSSLLLLSSCSTSFDPSKDLNGTRDDIMSMLQSEDITQRFSIDSENFFLFSNNGSFISADANSFVFKNSGIPATGMIDFEIIELFTKSEILRYGIVTQSNNSILESDGEFLFSAYQNGQPLRLGNDKYLNLLVPNSNPNPSMELFSAGEGTWWPTGDSLNVNLSNGPDSISTYSFFVNTLNWVNIDYFTKFDLELTDISICLPDGYENDKISLWVVFRDLDVVLGSSGDNLPIGEVVYIVCIAAEDEDTFRLDIREVTIEEGLKVLLDPKKETEENIKIRLKELD